MQAVTDIDELDQHCYDIGQTLQDIINSVRPQSPEAPDIAESIPSIAQRAKFDAMVTLLTWSESFAATLRYDVSTTHDECKYHDEWARESIVKLKEAIAAL